MDRRAAGSERFCRRDPDTLIALSLLGDTRHLPYSKRWSVQPFFLGLAIALKPHARSTLFSPQQAIKIDPIQGALSS